MLGHGLIVQRVGLVQSVANSHKSGRRYAFDVPGFIVPNCVKSSFVACAHNGLQAVWCVCSAGPGNWKRAAHATRPTPSSGQTALVVVFEHSSEIHSDFILGWGPRGSCTYMFNTRFGLRCRGGEVCPPEDAPEPVFGGATPEQFRDNFSHSPLVVLELTYDCERGTIHGRFPSSSIAALRVPCLLYRGISATAELFPCALFGAASGIRLTLLDPLHQLVQ